MGVTWSSNAGRGSRVPRSASRPGGPRAATPRRIRDRLRAALHRGRVPFRRPAPVELSPLAHALDVLAHR